MEGVTGLFITCEDTGVTLGSECIAVIFYHTTEGSKTYSTPGGPGHDCDTIPNAHNYTSGTASGIVPINDPVVLPTTY